VKILITGSDGFIAQNLISYLKRENGIKLYFYNKEDSLDILEVYIKESNFIFHLAGVNRPKNTNEFYTGNRDLTQFITQTLKKLNKNIPILFTSSIQVKENNDYGKSKLEAEEILIDYSKKMNANIFIYRLPNVFGKWSKPNYNSVISTWCYNIANNIDIKINNRESELSLVYIDDVIKAFLNRLANNDGNRYYEIDIIYSKTLGEIEKLLYSFKKNRETLIMPNVANGFNRALYATYLSFLPTDNFSYPLKGYKDERGTFYEILKTSDSGQCSISTTAPNIKRGGHFHHTKNEKFLVVKGEALIQLRDIRTDEVIEYKINDKNMKIVEMIPGYTHNIQNIGNQELILFLWANENYDKNNPDTYYLEV